MKRIKIYSCGFDHTFKNGLSLSTTVNAHRFQRDKFWFKVTVNYYRHSLPTLTASVELGVNFKECGVTELRQMWETIVCFAESLPTSQKGIRPIVRSIYDAKNAFTLPVEDCLIDNHHGIYANGICLEMAKGLGFQTDLTFSQLANHTHYGKRQSDKVWDSIIEQVDDATDFIGLFAPVGSSVYWNDGDLIVAVDSDDDQY